MATVGVHETVAEPSATGRRRIRFIAAALSGIVAVLYLVLLVLVAKAEAVPGATDGNTFGAYLFLAIPYLIGAGVLVVVDRRALWAAGAAVQLLVLALFVIFAVGLLGPGVFEYDALSDLRMELWAIAITSLEVVLLGLLSYLFLTTAPRQASLRPPSQES